jgi:hypothetical protein
MKQAKMKGQVMTMNKGGGKGGGGKAAVSKVATGQAQPATRQVAGGEIIPPEANNPQGGMVIAIPPF